MSMTQYLQSTPAKHQRDDNWSRLLERVGSARDEQAFAELFANFAPLIKGFCLGNLNSSFPADAAEEIVQEVMFKVWQKAPSYESTKAAASTCCRSSPAALQNSPRKSPDCRARQIAFSAANRAD